MNQEPQAIQIDDVQNAEYPVPDSQVITHTAPWLIYSLGFSAHPKYPYRLAIGSFKEEVANEIHIVQLNMQGPNQMFEKKAGFVHNYPATKLIWIPDKEGSSPDLLATSGENLKLWQVVNNNEVKMKAELQNQFSAPLTSFDWNPTNLNTVVTSSIDTTCAIWDVQKCIPKCQLIAHDKQAYDVHFSKDKDIFASVGADGSVRQFDLRHLEHSTVLYQTDNIPLLKLAWNRSDSHYLAVLEMNQSYITLLDSRKPGKPMGHLKNHKDCVNSIAWAPNSSYHLCSVGDDKQAFIWDLKGFRQTGYFPFLQYRADDQISNLTWSISQPQWISICYKNFLQILQFC